MKNVMPLRPQLFTTINDVRISQNQFLRYTLTVFVGWEAAINFTDQDSAILVAYPRGDGHVVDTSHH